MRNYNDKVSEVNSEIPAVVNEKWSAALADIRKGEVQRDQKPQKHIFSIACKSLGGVAAAFVMLISVGFVNPVFAEELPFVGNIVNFLKNGETRADAPDIIHQNSEIEGGFLPISQTEGETSLSVREAYCDGNTLIFTISMEMDESLSKYDVVSPDLEVKINGMNSQLHTTGFQKMEDGSFAGIATVDVSEMELSGQADLEVSANKVNAVDYHTLILADFLREKYTTEEQQELVNNMSIRERNSLPWENQRYESEISPQSFTGTVKVDKSLRKTYVVNKEENGCNVKSITASPSSTLFNLEMPDETVCFITDNMGNEIEHSEIAEDNFDLYGPLYNGAETLTFSFYAMNDRRTPVAVIEAAVDGGYAEKWEAKPIVSADDEITYIPALPELPEDWLNREPEDTVVNLGDAIAVSDGEAANEMVISNLRVYDSPEDAGIDSSELIRYNDTPGSKFVLVDVELKNEGDIGIACNIQPDFKHPGLAHDGSVPEISYFSEASGGIKNYYAAEEKGKLQAQVGFCWSSEDLASGNLQLTIVNDIDDDEQWQYTHVEVPPYEG